MSVKIRSYCWLHLNINNKWVCGPISEHRHFLLTISFQTPWPPWPSYPPPPPPWLQRPTRTFLPYFGPPLQTQETLVKFSSILTMVPCVWEVSNVCRSFLTSFTPRKVGKVFLGDISKSLQWKAILINQIHTIWWQSPQSPNHGPNSFPLLIRISSKLQIAVLSKFWVVACQLKYFKTSLIFAFISIPISLLGLFIVQQDSQNEDKCEILWTWGGCIFLLHTIHFSTAVKCMKYHEYEDDVKYFLKWFTFQPVSPSYCSPDPVTGNLPFDCIDIIDVRES